MTKSSKKIIILILGMALLSECSGKLYAEDAFQFTSEKYSPRKKAYSVINTALEREPVTFNNELHYSEACFAYGALGIADIYEDSSLIEKIIERYPEFSPNSEHVDAYVNGIIPLKIYMVTGDKQLLNKGLSIADAQWANPRKDGLTHQARFWVDDMYMVGMLQTMAYRATGDTKYADRAAEFYKAYIDKLFQPEGLFRHGLESPHFWGRGNGWAATAMAEFLRSLPEDYPKRSVILKTYLKMMNTLLQYQTENGMWRQIVDYPYSWTESSCTAMFAYAMSIGLQEDLITENKKQYQKAVKKAWIALCEHLNSNNKLRKVCVGTGQTDNIEYYLMRPRSEGDLHGMAPYIWLAESLIKANEG